MAEGRALITEDDVLKKLLDQTEIGIVKENNDGDDDDFNNLELLGLTDTEKFIDKKYIDVQIMKAVGNIKQMIRDEVHKLHTSQEKPQQNDSKDKIIFILENNIMFLEEEIRRKNDQIDTLIHTQKAQDLSHKTDTPSNDKDSNSKNLIPLRLSDTNITKRKGNSKSISCQTNDNAFFETQKKAVKTSSTEKITEKIPEKKERENVIICGDSMLNGIDGDGISNKDTCVSVKSFGGSTTKDMIDYIKPSARKKPNKIIVHVGTNDITKKISDSTKNLNRIVETVREISPDTKICFSELCIRNDISGGFSQVKRLNDDLIKFCNERNFGGGKW